MNKITNFNEKKTLFKAIIKAQSGVLYLKGKPGIGKTALFQEIAKEESWSFVDCRLAQMDETDFRFPYLMDYNNSKVSSFAYPKWIHESMEKPTLIMFDEINRASLAVRNAALQMLNERMVGDLKLNDNVYMVAVGNLGEEDGTEVEEFDTALNNRLIHYKYDMTFPEWKKGFAEKNVNPHILSFVENNLDYYYRAPIDNDNEGAYPTPRSWTFLSNLVDSVYGRDVSPQQFLPLIINCGHSYVGKAVTKLLRYLEDISSLNIKDVINRFSQIKDQVEKLTRDRKSELLASLKKENLDKYFEMKNGEEKLNNIADFLNIIDEDERVGFLNDYLDNVDLDEIVNNKNFKKFLKKFSDIFKKIKALSV